MDKKEVARRLADVMPILEGIIQPRIDEYQSKLIHIMSSRPETLTGKTAITYASKQKALKDFIEDLRDEVRLNLKEVP